MRTLVMAFAIAALPWHAEAGTRKLFETSESSRGGSRRATARSRSVAISAFRELSLRWRTGQCALSTTSTRSRHVAPASGVVLDFDQGHSHDRPARSGSYRPSRARGSGVRRKRPRGGLGRDLDGRVEDPATLSRQGCCSRYLDAGTVRSIALSGETTATPRLAGDTVLTRRGRAHIEGCIDGPRRDIVIELEGGPRSCGDPRSDQPVARQVPPQNRRARHAPCREAAAARGISNAFISPSLKR